jgi:uncharacterized protein
LITRRGFLKTIGAGLVAAGGTLFYATGIEAMGRPRVQGYKFTPSRWTEGLKLRIVLLSDLHSSNPWMDLKRIRGICDQANALNGDIILLTGDYVNAIDEIGGAVPNRECANLLASLQAPLGVHAVLGNHDYWQDSGFETDPRHYPDIAHKLGEAGVKVYVNEASRLEKDGKPFWIAGLGDQLALVKSQLSGPTNGDGVDDLPTTMVQIKDDAPVILMAHEPDIFPQVSDRVSLTLSGHTHGGQVNLFGWTPVMNSRYGTRYRGGHVVENGRHIVISRGLGCTSYPVRIGAWPEIVVMELG